MVCEKCRRQIEAGDAYTCDFCGENFCGMCASMMGICECYGDLKHYS